MATIFILALIGVVMNWILAFLINYNFNIFLHVIFVIAAWQYSPALGIIGIIVGSFALIINLVIVGTSK